MFEAATRGASVDFVGQNHGLKSLMVAGENQGIDTTEAEDGENEDFKVEGEVVAKLKN